MTDIESFVNRAILDGRKDPAVKGLGLDIPEDVFYMMIELGGEIFEADRIVVDNCYVSRLKFKGQLFKTAALKKLSDRYK